MTFIRIISIFIAIISLISCSASYEELIKSDHKPEDEISKHLLIAYKTMAKFEAKEMHDWNSAKLYSEKAIKAAKGEKIIPQHISYWKIPSNKIEKTSEIRLEIIKAYNNLMIIYDDALGLDPYNLAKAISSLDCWSEQQEENWQTWDINKCRDDYLDAMHTLYNAIAENKEGNIKKNNSNSNKDNDTAVVVTEDVKKNILHVIYFDFDKSNLTNISINKIHDFIKINNDKISNYIVVGHTDTKGTKEYNQILSKERAKNVKSILLKLGINSNNIKILGKGESDLRVKTDDEFAHPANRRAEISLLN